MGWAGGEQTKGLATVDGGKGWRITKGKHADNIAPRSGRRSGGAAGNQIHVPIGAAASSRDTGLP